MWYYSQTNRQIMILIIGSALMFFFFSWILSHENMKWSIGFFFVGLLFIADLAFPKTVLVEGIIVDKMIGRMDIEVSSRTGKSVVLDKQYPNGYCAFLIGTLDSYEKVILDGNERAVKNKNIGDHIVVQYKRDWLFGKIRSVHVVG